MCVALFSPQFNILLSAQVSHSQFLNLVRKKTGHISFSPNQLGDFTDTVQCQGWKQALSHPGTAVGFRVHRSIDARTM